jgi:hypothetical protein
MPQEQQSPPKNPMPKSADEIRHALTEAFKKFEPQLLAYHDYAEQVGALGLEYHRVRISETFQVPIEEGVLAATLDCRATPKSLDLKLEQLKEVTIKRVIFDPVKGLYYLYV